MRDILEWSEHFFDWTGRRVDLLNNILSLEKGDPERFLMYSKKFKKYLPVSMRRIQDFINKGRGIRTPALPIVFPTAKSLYPLNPTFNPTIKKHLNQFYYLFKYIYYELSSK